MISMMLFYSCTCTTNRTGETKVQWNPHNTHIHTQMGHSTIVCITGPQKKCCRHCFIDYVKDSEQKSLGLRKVSVVHIN